MPEGEKREAVQAVRPKANVTDLLRIVAAFCIVWYHNSFYFTLQGTDRSVVDTAKALFISWALPFFYVTAVSFAYRTYQRTSTWNDLSTRLWRLVRLVIIFIGVYEIPYVAWYVVSRFFGWSVAYTPFGLVFDSGSLILQSAAHAIVSVRDSPAYFLNHLIVLTIGTYLVARFTARSPGRLGVASGALLVLVVGSGFVPAVFDQYSGWLGLNRLAVVLWGAALWYEMAVLRVTIVTKQWIKHPVTVFLIILMLVVGIGWCYWAGARWYMLPAVGFLWLRDQCVRLSSRVSEWLSNYGREYALGIFLWHYFFLIFFANIAKIFHPAGRDLLTFIVTTLAGLAVTIGWVAICRRVTWLRFLVTL